MSSINGASHHNVEDILASIRTSIADEGTSSRSYVGENSTLNTRRDIRPGPELSEFDLPAIFKPGHQSAPDKPNLFGRLSDAMKAPQHADQDRSRTVIRFEPAAGRMIEPPQPAAPEQPQQTQASAPIATAASASDESVKRVMPTFFDTRLNRMGELTREVNTPAPAPEPVVARLPAKLPMPPMLPEYAAMPGQNGAVEDAAAMLLRPILKQWLTENMPKIVEKALRSESGDDDPSDMRRR